MILGPDNYCHLGEDLPLFWSWSSSWTFPAKMHGSWCQLTGRKFGNGEGSSWTKSCCITIIFLLRSKASESSYRYMSHLMNSGVIMAINTLQSRIWVLRVWYGMWPSVADEMMMSECPEYRRSLIPSASKMSVFEHDK